MLDDLFDGVSVGEGDGRSGSVGDQFFGNVAGKRLWFGENKFLKRLEVFEVATVGHIITGVDRLRLVLPVFLAGVVSVSPLAGWIEILERKSWRVDLDVTACAGSVSSMLRQHLAN